MAQHREWPPVNARSLVGRVPNGALLLSGQPLFIAELEEVVMKKRMTQMLLAIVGVLLITQLFRPAPAAFNACAADGDEVPAVLRARMIELVDERGTVRASLRTGPTGEVTFRLTDAKGTIRVKIGAGEDGSGLVLLDDRTEPGVHLLARRNATSVTLTKKDREKLVIIP
jgi:hypothetical protein